MALIYCPECGKQVSDSASTCPHCGYSIASLNLGANNAGTGADYSKPEEGKYNVFLTAALSEGVSATARVLADVLGYSYADALALANNLPTIVLYNVTITQAKAAACALADYGLDVGVYDENGYVDFSDYEYDAEDYTTTESGTSIASELLKTIRTISVTNLISRAFMRRYSYPFPYETWIPFTRGPRYFYDPYYRRWNYYRRPSLLESLLGLNRGYRYYYNPMRYSSMPSYRSNYRTPGAPPRTGFNPTGNPRPGNSRPSGGGLFGGLFSGGTKGGSSTIGGTSKPGMGHSTRTYRTSGSGSSGSGTKRSFGGWPGSTGNSGSGLFGRLFGSSKSSGVSHSSSRSSSTRSSSSGSGFGSFGSLFGSSKSSGFGHSSSSSRSSGFGSFGSRSSGGGFGSRSGGSFGSRSSGGGKIGGGSKGGFGHGKR